MSVFGGGFNGSAQHLLILLDREVAHGDITDMVHGDTEGRAAERLIGSIRRECLDHIVVFGEAHLRRILAGYAGYYNERRMHLSLGKDASRHRQVQRLGQFAAQPILDGLHHEYCRM